MKTTVKRIENLKIPANKIGTLAVDMEQGVVLKKIFHCTTHIIQARTADEALEKREKVR